MKKRATIQTLAILIWLWTPSYAANLFYLATPPSGHIVRLSGEIAEGDAKKLATLVRSGGSSSVDVIQLDSLGGNVLEAEKAAAIIHTAGVSVWVQRGDVCASACFLLFASGEKRIISRGALIGVHSASIKGNEDVASLAVTTLIARDAKAYGVPDSILGKIVSTEPGSITWLSASDLGEMRVQFEQLRPPVVKLNSSPIGQIEFKGTYVCFQGLTGMKLRVTRKQGEDVALFEFGAVPSNPDVPQGAFELKGRVDTSVGSLYLIPTHWVRQPGNYLMVGLSGSSSDGGKSFSGRIIGGVDCSEFKIVSID